MNIKAFIHRVLYGDATCADRLDRLAQARPRDEPLAKMAERLSGKRD